MSYALCPHCEEKFYPFGESHINRVALQYGIPLLSQLPIDPNYAKLCDAGQVESIDPEPLAAAVDLIERL